MESILGMLGIDTADLKELEKMLKIMCCRIEENNLMLRHLCKISLEKEERDKISLAFQDIEKRYC
jgi:hypothetical protein